MSAIVVNRKGRGRPATGRTLVGVRMLPEELASVDRWIEAQAAPLTRPEAVRQLVAHGLAKST
jgi:hypothetical protein